LSISLDLIYVILTHQELLFTNFLALTKYAHPFTPLSFCDQVLLNITALGFLLEIMSFICNIHNEINNLGCNLNIEMSFPRFFTGSDTFVFNLVRGLLCAAFLFSIDSILSHLFFDPNVSLNLCSVSVLGFGLSIV